MRMSLVCALMCKCGEYIDWEDVKSRQAEIALFGATGHICSTCWRVIPGSEWNSMKRREDKARARRKRRKRRGY